MTLDQFLEQRLEGRKRNQRKIEEENIKFLEYLLNFFRETPDKIELYKSLENYIKDRPSLITNNTDNIIVIGNHAKDIHKNESKFYTILPYDILPLNTKKQIYMYIGSERFAEDAIFKPKSKGLCRCQ